MGKNCKTNSSYMKATVLTYVKIYLYNMRLIIANFNVNSIAKDEDNHYLVSARHASTIYKINGIDGSIIGRLGGLYSSFHLGEDVEFGFQHHARWVDPKHLPSHVSVTLNKRYVSLLIIPSMTLRALEEATRTSEFILIHVENTSSPITMLGRRSSFKHSVHQETSSHIHKAFCKHFLMEMSLSIGGQKVP